MRLFRLGLCGLATLLQPAEATIAGLGLSVNEHVLQQSKTVIVNYIAQIFTEVKIDDVSFDFMGSTNSIHDMKFKTIHADPNDVAVRIDGDTVFIDIQNIGGDFSGKSTKHGWFNT